MATKITIGGKSYEEYFAEKKEKNGELFVKSGKQVLDFDGLKTENIYHDSTVVPCDGDTLILGEAVLTKGGRRVELSGRIEFKGGAWYENGNKVDI